MLELDLLLERFIDTQFTTLSDEELMALEELLALQDPELYHCLMSDDKSLEKELAKIVSKIKSHHPG